jgi:uncharacterized protein (TIGR02270 family)
MESATEATEKGLAPPEQHDAPFLWLAREAVARGPNGRLIDLARYDERLTAYLEAIRVHRTSVGLAVKSEADRGGPAADFLIASFSMMVGDLKFFNTLVEAESPAARVRAITAALAWAEREVAIRVIDQLSRSTTPLWRAIGIAALGTRRADPGASLNAAFADPHPLVRACAYRTTGQLGRTDLMDRLALGLEGHDLECRFWAAWAAARNHRPRPGLSRPRPSSARRLPVWPERRSGGRGRGT